MTYAVRDRICETSTTTGTGTMSLSGSALTGFHVISWGVATGKTFWYLIENVDVPTEWEVGIGTYTSGTPGTVARTVPYDGSAGVNTLTAFSAGTKRIHLCASSESLKWIGCVATKSGDNLGVDYTTSSQITFDTNTLSTSFLGSLHNTSTQTSRLRLDSTTMAEGFVKLAAQIILANITAAQWVDLQIVKNGTTTIARSLQSALTTSPSLQIIAPVQSAALTDYFEVWMQVQSDTSVDVKTGSWFQIEVLQ